MSAAHKSENPAATGFNANNQRTNAIDFATGKRPCKDETELLARLQKAGHVVRRGVANDYTCCKYGYAQHCADVSELTAFAIRLGVL
jgi:hypothetical protein